MCGINDAATSKPEPEDPFTDLTLDGDDRDAN